MYTTLISAPELQALLASQQPCRVFDCSFDLMQAGAGDQQYRQAHIPGALRADLDRHLSAAPGAPDAASGGRHPLPSREAFAAWLGSTGLTPGMQAVVYDRQGANYCGRLWWMLKWLGHEAAAVLDGGLQAWQALDGAIASAPDDAPLNSDLLLDFKQKYPLDRAGTRLVTTNTIAEQLGGSRQCIVDARAAPRFRGEVEPLDPVAGHIPGALNRPFSLNFEANGKFKPAAVLRQEFEQLLGGRDPASVVHHCGSGVSAVPNVIAMEIAGLGRAGLYAGSWSEWCSDPARPVAQG
ncbi:MAG: hypothetical protein RIS90_584 [Pseudomonadota bacterium]